MIQERTSTRIFSNTLGLMGWLLSGFVLGGVALPSTAIAGKSADVQKAIKLLRRWRASEAEKLLKPYLKDRIQSNNYLYAMARTRFFQGKYKEGMKLLERITSDKKQLMRYPMYRAMVAAHKVTKDFKEVQSPHFTIAYPPGPDRVLVPYAIQALEKAYKELGDLYGYRPPTRVRIEILKTAMNLADMSPLTEGDIVRTGTIALCKYNRVMITSPRALYRGYRWLDTLVHEYTHLVINRVVDGIPIWMHEGLARFSETLWRKDQPEGLSPYSETLLARAVKKNKLITFKQMHPSMAKLPSQEDAALAYAQVFTLIKFFVKNNGRSSIARVLQEIHQGKKVPEAFSKIVRMPFDQYLEVWKYDLSKQKLKEYNDLAPEKKVLKGHAPQKKKKKKDERNFWFRPTSPKELGARFLQLAELLRMNKRNKAALLEYLKAEKHWKNLRPKLQNKIAKTYFLLRKHRHAIPHLKHSLQLHPNYVTTHVNLGLAYFYARQLKQAIESFTEAAHINPFHPKVHFYLARIYRMLGKERKAHQSTRNYQLIRRHQ